MDLKRNYLRMGGVTLVTEDWSYCLKTLPRKLHIGIIGAAAALRRNPIDILSGIFNITCFAVNAVL